MDWVGTDLFANSPNFRGLNRFYRDRRWRRKPFMLGEWALWGQEDPGFVRRLFAWIARHPRAKMQVYNQGAHHPRLLALRWYPRSARELRRRARSRRFAAYPPELRRRRRPRAAGQRARAAARTRRRRPPQPGPSGGEPLPAEAARLRVAVAPPLRPAARPPLTSPAGARSSAG